MFEALNWVPAPLLPGERIVVQQQLTEKNMVNVKKHLGLLGLKVQDKVTGFKGVVASIHFDLYGCVQALVNPGKGKDGKLGEQVYFDVSRLEVKNPKPVMDVPNYEYGPQAEGKQGPAEKPRDPRVVPAKGTAIYGIGGAKP